MAKGDTAFRQAVVSVRKPTGATGSTDVDKLYYPPEAEILFRQPYHNLGLAMTFNFQQSFFTPFSTCSLMIENNSTKMADVFKFDNMDYTKPRYLSKFAPGIRRSG